MALLLLILWPNALQRDRQEQIEEKKALKRQEREMARRHEFVRRCRIAVEEKRQKVGCMHHTAFKNAIW